jgi:hypothetical protein
MFKYKFNLKEVFFYLIVIIVFFSCKKNELKREVKISTKGVSEVMATTATVTGEIIDLGEGIIDYGLYYSTTANSPGGIKVSVGKPNATGEFIVEIAGLKPSTKYFTYVYAEIEGNFLYGSEVSFSTQALLISDIDGNIYKTVQIGSQLWMAENLKNTKYNDGTGIPNIIENTAWTNLTTPGYCLYNNAATYKDTYGALYNWYAVDVASNGGKNICPIGWHVPNDGE